jgi:hypothetical protein
MLLSLVPKGSRSIIDQRPRKIAKPLPRGESASRPTPAALAIDATGIRLRPAPFTPARLKPGLA